MKGVLFLTLTCATNMFAMEQYDKCQYSDRMDCCYALKGDVTQAHIEAQMKSFLDIIEEVKRTNVNELQFGYIGKKSKEKGIDFKKVADSFCSFDSIINLMYATDNNGKKEEKHLFWLFVLDSVSSDLTEEYCNHVELIFAQMSEDIKKVKGKNARGFAKRLSERGCCLQ